MACTALPASSNEVITFESYCDETRKIGQELSEKYQEYPLVYGNTADIGKSLMSLWINPTTKSWTIVATKDDLSCIIGYGDNFNIIKKQPKL